MDRQAIRRLVELAIGVALAAVLTHVRVCTLPQGGSVTAGSMVPIFYIALRWGVRWGLLAGGLAGIVTYIAEPFFVHPVQVLLDYPIAFGAIGLAGLFHRNPVVGVVVGGVGRFLAHFISGIVFFASYAPKGILTVLVLRAIRPAQLA